MSFKQLRWYQEAANNAVFGYFLTNTGHPLIVLPTGTGKSLCIAELIRQIMESWPGQRLLVLSHVKELLAQDYEALMDQYPQADAGIYSAGLRRRDTMHAILFAGIQSVYKRAMELGRFDLILIDEAHTVPPDGEGQYKTFLEKSIEINPAIKIIGYTATPFRTSQGLLTEGDNRIFTDIAYDGTESILQMIEQNYLAPLVTKRTETEYDVSGVPIRKGDYVQSGLQAAFDKESLTKAAVQEMLAYGHDRKSWLVFCSGVDHAYHVADELNDQGIPTGCVVGSTTDTEREKILSQFKSGVLRCVTNMGVLTTGFNHPGIDLIALLRATKSPGLYVQMMGRGMRTHPEKANCLVLDFAGVVKEHGPIDLIRPKPKSARESGDAPVKDCPQCNSRVPAGIRYCPDCGHEFEFKTKIEPTASQAPILSSQEDPSRYLLTHSITEVQYSRHEKEGKPPSLRVDYYDGYLKAASEWVCLEHEGFARKKAVRWWQERDPLAREFGSAPENLDEAFACIADGDLKEPTSITINVKGRFPEIVGYRFDEIEKPKQIEVDEYSDEIPFDELPLNDDGVLFDDEIPF